MTTETILLADTDPKYLRRLAKALNEHSYHGFYCYCNEDGSGERFNQARVSGGRLMIRLASAQWLDATGKTMADPYGQSITASHHPKWS